MTLIFVCLWNGNDADNYYSHEERICFTKKITKVFVIYLL